MTKLRRLTLLLTALAVVPFAWADEEFDTLQSEFDAAQVAWATQINEAQSDEATADAQNPPPHPAQQFLPRFKAYAEKRAGQPEALAALVWIVNASATGSLADQGGPSGAWAVDRLASDHPGDSELLTLLRQLRYAAYTISGKPLIALYERVIQTNTNSDAVAWAVFSLGYTLYENLPDNQGFHDKEQALRLFRRGAKEFAGTEVGERAAGYVYEIENLQVGMVAPEIVGPDVRGNEIRLSQFRGQVVMLDFWGFW